MEILVSLYVLLGLLSARAAHSHKDYWKENIQNTHLGLSCVNDFVNTVSCTWDGSPAAPGVDCWIFGVKTTWILKNSVRIPGILRRSCKLKQHGNSPPGCSFVFENEEFNPFKDMPSIRVECNGMLVDNVTNYSPYKHIQMHPPDVPDVNSTVNETRISWSLGRTSIFFTSFLFQVQIKKTNNTWSEARTLSTQEQQLRIPSWKLEGHWQVRVRVKPTEQQHNRWSDWSPTASWEGATNTAATSQDQRHIPEGLLGHMSLVMGAMFSVGLVIVTLVLCRRCVSTRLLKGKPVPTPSKYFHTLDSVHEGNLKKWLNPLSASESFFTTQPCDRISPVEVCKSWDVVPSAPPLCDSTSALLHFRSHPSVASDTRGPVDSSSSSSSSCFSNMGYFMSSSSGGSARSDPQPYNPAYFTYRDDVRNLRNEFHLSLCPSLGTSPAYESLKREPQSPDSGFGMGKEDEEGGEGKRVVGEEGEEVLDDRQSPPLLIFPLHLPSRMCPPSSAAPPPNVPGKAPTASDSLQVDAPATAAGGSYAAWPTAGAMCRSSSMPVEPCKTGYLTLKELQTTFSNKSI